MKDSTPKCHNGHGRLGSRSIRGRVVLIAESSGCFWPEDVPSGRKRMPIDAATQRGISLHVIQKVSGHEVDETP